MSEELLNCPNCGFSRLDLTVVDGQMIFLCENCGWQKIEENYFYLTGWSVEIRQALAPVDVLH
jgi:transcription elongation factor Elf1